jgi:UDP-N-acetylmuramoyl-tripeptide--D-alanyl-D-alanine ligase
MAYQPNLIKKLFHYSRRKLAQFWLSRQPGLTIAITGSQGKTNTTYILSCLLNHFGKTLVTDRNLDTIYNVPITALKANPSYQYLLFELGVDHINEMNLHLEIVKPQIAIITGISPVHTDQEHFGSLENLIKEKRKLIEALPKKGYAILNYDNPHVKKMAKFTQAKVIFYGLNQNAHYSASNIKITLSGTQFILEKKSITTKLIGAQQVYNLLAAYAVAKIINPKINAELFSKIIAPIKPLTGRMSLEKGPLGTILLNDSLRANPASTRFGLETLSNIYYPQGKKIAILAEMGELQHPEAEHSKIGILINQLQIDTVICIGPLQKFTYQKIKTNPHLNAYYTSNVFAAADILKQILHKNDLLYLKGSLLRHVERVLLLLEGKTVNCQKIVCDKYNLCPNCPELI